MRRWDASKLRELRKRLDSGSCTVEEIDDVAADFLDGEIVDLASDWLGNTVSPSVAPEDAMSYIFFRPRLYKSSLNGARLDPVMPC